MTRSASVLSMRVKDEVLPSASAASKGLVVLLHGILAGQADMRPMASAFAEAGYDTLNIGYPSTAAPIADLADAVGAVLVRHHDGARPIHFATHSMGGIVTRHLVARARPAGLGRIAMIAPPNRGSEVADLLAKLPFHGLALGPAALELTTTAASAVPMPECSIGVVAGTASLNPLSRFMFNGSNDGCVSVERSRLSPTDPLRTLRSPHPIIMRDPRAIRLALRFVETGSFD